MRTSRSKHSDLDITANESSSQSRPTDGAKTYGGFTSFFARSKRNKLPTPVPLSLPREDELGELHNLTKRDLRRSSLGSRNYKAMSRSMNDLGSIMSRVQLNDTSTAVMDSCPSPVRSISAKPETSDSSPTKRRTSKKELSTPFSATAIKKEGWLNKRGNKKETSMKLHRVYLRDSKLYVYKPPSDVAVRAFDLSIPLMDSSSATTNGGDGLTISENLTPAEFPAEVRSLLYDMDSSTTKKLFLSAVHLYEVHDPPIHRSETKHLAIITTSSLLLFGKARQAQSLTAQDSGIAESTPRAGHASGQSLWLLEEDIPLKLAQIFCERDGAKTQLVLKQDHATKKFDCDSAENLLAMMEHYNSSQSASIGSSTKVNPIQNDTSEECSEVAQASQELFSVRQIVRDDTGKIIRGTLSGLCRQILLEKSSPADANTPSSVLLSTVGLWATAEDILRECCSQLNILAENATRNRPDYIVRALITSAGSLLLDSRNVEGLLQLISFADTEQQVSLKKELWDSRTHLLAVITMDLVHLGIVSIHPQEPHWSAPYRSLSQDGLQAESILEIPANLFATQLHLFHQYYLKYWNPAQDLALFFSTDLRGASRNPLIFGPRRMHFLTSTIFCHILSIDSEPVTASQRAAMLKQWILIGMMLKRMGDMAGWIAILMAVCAPSVVRLKETWSMIEGRLRLVVEKEWSPVMRDLFRRNVSDNASLNSAHVLAPDADGLSVSAKEIVPFYGDLCSAIEEIHGSVIDDSHKSKATIDLEALQNGKLLLNTALDSYKLFVLELESEIEELDDDRASAIPAFQDCFKQLNSMPLDILDVCSPLLLGLSLKCEHARFENMTGGKESTQNVKAVGAFVPLVFTDLVPSFRLFEASMLLDIDDPGKRMKGQDQSASSATGLRRLNSFPPTQLPHNYPVVSGNLDETTRIRVAASVSQWKVLKHVKDLAGVSDRLIYFDSGKLILKDFEGAEDMTHKRRPQSLLVEERKRDSIVSRRSSTQYPDTLILEHDDDLVIRPQRYSPKQSSTREVVVKAATIDLLIDLLIFNISDLKYLHVDRSSTDVQLSSSTSHLEINRPEYLKMFLVSHRSYCTSSALIRALSDRLAKAFVVSALNKDDFPAWNTSIDGLISASVIDWTLLEKVYTGIFETVSSWLSIAPGDFTGSIDSYSLLEDFLSLAQKQLHRLDELAGQSHAAGVCRGLCASHLRKIRRQILRVRHRPQSWQIADFNEAGLEIHEAFAIARLSQKDDIHEAVKQLDRVVESVLQCITLEDWMQCYELFEIHKHNPKAFFPNIDEAAMDSEIKFQTVLDLLGSIMQDGATKTTIQCMPLPVRRLVNLRHSLTQWTVQQIADHTHSMEVRIQNIGIFLNLLSTCRVCMSTLDIKVTTGDLSTTQMIPSFIAGAVTAGLLTGESRQYTHCWHAVARRANQADASGPLTRLIPETKPSEQYLPIVPCIGWLFERMLEVACYIPDTSYENDELFNFDKRRYIYNLLSNLDLVSPVSENVSILDELDNRFIFLLTASPQPLNRKACRSAAAKENQIQRGTKVAKPFAQMVQQELEKTRRDHKYKELVDRQIRDAQKLAHRQLQEVARTIDPNIKRSTNRGRYGMNSILRAVRPLSVAITGNWAPEKHQGVARTIAPSELPTQCYIPRGTKPALTIDLVHAQIRICGKDEHLFEIGSEDGMNTCFQAPSLRDMELWVQELSSASITGASKRRTIIREDARLASIEESPQFSPRNSMVVDLVSATFGVELAILVRRDGSSTPRLASILISEIERRGLSEVGIYRISGSVSTIAALKRAFDSGKPVDLGEPQWNDINAIAGLFKLWLRELPEPLMTYKLYDQFLATLELPDHSAKSLALKNLIHQLPVPNFSMLKRLIEHLEAVTDYENTNHMYAHNLAIIFGPNILQPVPSTLSFAASMNDLGKVQTIIRNIIMQCHWIFSTEEETEEVLPATSVSLEPPILPRILEGDIDLVAQN